MEELEEVRLRMAHEGRSEPYGHRSELTLQQRWIGGSGGGGSDGGSDDGSGGRRWPATTTPWQQRWWRQRPRQRQRIKNLKL